MGPGKISPTTQWPAWLMAAALLIASWIAIAALSLQVRAGAQVVAVASPPWCNAQQALLAAASANADIVRLTIVPALLVVRPDDNDGLKRLGKAGAWLTVDPQGRARRQWRAAAAAQGRFMVDD